MVDVNPVDDETIIILEDEEEFLLPSGELTTSLEEIPDEEPIVLSENDNTVVIQVIVPGPRGLRGEDGEPGQDGLDGQPGQDGQPGADGADGADGGDGREVELSSNATHVLWRYVGDVGWNNLIALDDLGGGGEGTFARGLPRAATQLLGVPGTNFYAVSSMTAGTRRDMNPFEVEAPISVLAFDLEVLFPGTESTINVGIIAADTNNQPTGAVLAQANLNIGSSGAKRQAITPVTLPVGRYLLLHQGATTGSVTLRSYRAASRAISNGMGSSGIVERLRYTHSNGQALDASAWDQIVTTNFGQSFGVLMEYEYV